MPPSPSQVTEWRKTLEKASVDGAAYEKALRSAWRDIACSGDAAIYLLRGATPLYRVYGMGEAQLVDFIQGEDCPAFASLTAEKKILLLKHGGGAYNRKGEYDQAIADYNEAIKLDTPLIGLLRSIIENTVAQSPTTMGCRSVSRKLATANHSSVLIRVNNV
jgi:tetratricopeptide (TPR) repeat protein